MKIRELFETSIPEYPGHIKVPLDWTDLSGLPKLFPGYTPGCIVVGNFVCIDCIHLTSLQGGPSRVEGSFHCNGCVKLQSFEYGPTYVSGNFECSGCTVLKSLKYAPDYVGNYFTCNMCSALTSFEGSPRTIKNSFYISWCENLASFKGLPDYIGDVLFCTNNASLKDKPILSIFKIQKLKQIEIANKTVQNIINKHLDGNRDIFDCKEELVNAGYKEYAKL